MRKRVKRTQNYGLLKMCVCIAISARRLHLTLKFPRRFITEIRSQHIRKIFPLNQLCVRYHTVVTQVFCITSNN